MDAFIGELRRFGVDPSFIVRQNGRLGIYFVEPGANQRPSKVVYDRDGCAISLAKPGDIDWNKALDGANWFHITGIAPALSQSAADLSLEALQAARTKGLTVSCDFNYRKNLWKYGKNRRSLIPVSQRLGDRYERRPDAVRSERLGACGAAGIPEAVP